MAVRQPALPVIFKRTSSSGRVAAWLPNDTQEMEAHIRLLHPEGSDGFVVLAEKWHGKYAQAQHRARGRITAEVLGRAQFVSMNRFKRGRAGDMLCTVGHVWLEFDPYGEDAQGKPLPHRDMPLEDLRILIAAAIAAAGLPEPSYWSKSGRGLHAVWACEALPGYAARKVQRILDALYGPTLNADGSVPARRFEDPDRDAQEARLAPMWRVFRDAGLDTGTQDSSRVLRIWGSFNQASGTLCERMWPSRIEDIRRCTVDALADAVLPITREELRRRLAERAANPVEPAAPPKAERPRRTPSATAYAGKVGVWDRKLADLLRLRQHRGRIAKGHRHAWVFLTANAHAQAKGGTAATWAELLAPLAGLTVADALDCLRSLDRRQARHEAGETTEHDGVVWSPLFHYSGSKMANLLGVTEEEADAAGLNLVRPGTGRAIPPIERKAAKRVRDGAVPRADRADAKLQAGRQGLALRTAGKTADEAIAAIRAATGRGRTWAIEAMKVAAASPVEDVVETAAPAPSDVPAAVRKSGLERVRFSGRYIGGSCPAPASAPSAPPVPAPVDAPKPYARPTVIQVSDISTRLLVADGVEYLVVDDPKDKVLGRWVLLFVDGQHADATLPAHLEPYLPVRRRRAPRPVRSASRRRPVTEARSPFRPGMTTAEEYRRLTRGF